VTLAAALATIMAERELSVATLAQRLGTYRSRSTVERLLSGATTNPRVGTLLALCAALEVSPTELLERADLWPRHERGGDVLDARLRRVFAQVQALPASEKERAIRVLAVAVRVLAEPPSPSDETVLSR
jgi:DNA-binding Xre family transcriptional regulator